MSGAWLAFGRAVGCQGVIHIEREGLGRIAEALKGSLGLVQLSFIEAGGGGANAFAAEPASEAENDFPRRIREFRNDELWSYGDVEFAKLTGKSVARFRQVARL